jgi:hypothetical protein
MNHRIGYRGNQALWAQVATVVVQYLQLVQVNASIVVLHWRLTGTMKMGLNCVMTLIFSIQIVKLPFQINAPQVPD